jgi:PAS domain S-box-containing protein
MMICWYISNSCEALIGASLIRFLIAGRFQLLSIRHVWTFLLCGVFLGPFLSSFLDAAFVRLNRWGPGSYWEIWRIRLFSNMLTALALVPAILMLFTNDYKARARVRFGRCLEAAILALGLIVVSYEVFVRYGTGAESIPGLLYAPLPFLLWAAVRFGPGGASMAVLSTALLAIWGGAQGHGPFSGRFAEAHVISLQLFLIGTSTLLLLLGAGISDREKAEERFVKAFHSNPVAMIISRLKDGQVIDANERWQELSGYTRDEIIGQRVFDLNIYTSERDRKRLAERPGFGNSLSDWELKLRTKSGGVLQTILSAEVEEIGGDPCFILNIRDITGWKRAEEALRKSEERYREVVESQTDLVCRYLPDTTLTFVNEAYCRFFGRDRDDLIGCKFIELIPREAHGLVLENIRSLSKEQSAGTIEHEVVLGNGGKRWQQWMNYAILDEEGNIGELQAIGRDITDRKLAEEARQSLAHSSRLAVVGELTAMIAHEVNQPLGAILSNADAAEMLLNSKEVPLEEIQRILVAIKQNDLRASEAVRRIRTLVRKREVENQRLDLNEVIVDVVELVAGDALKRRVRFKKDLAADLPGVRGDRVHLEQVLLNLTLNAMDAMVEVPESERRITIQTSRNGGDTIQIAIIDTGPGIGADKLPHIFESFFTTKKEGMGLGLSIARSIIEAHQGRIWAENNPGGGAAFRFELPVDMTEEPGVQSA